MDATKSVSPLWYRRTKPLGKVRQRVQELRIPSFSCHDFTAIRPRLDLSHNESARLAADRLLSHGLQGYQEVLNAEGEVDFLSELDKNYILEKGRDSNAGYGDTSTAYEEEEEFESLSTGCHSCSRRSSLSVSADSDTIVEEGNQSGLKDLDDPGVEVFFQPDRSAAGMKDLVRQFISKAKLALAIVMDTFSDTELLCDLLEASKTRNVSVHLLLDQLNLSVFLNMWQDLKLNSNNFPKLSVRSVHGETYCAKTGRKLTGQISESFIITDWTEVLTGSYSFTWLSWQVHRSLAVLIKGSSVTSFLQEFHRLYSSSEPVAGFVSFITVPHTLAHSSKSQTAHNINTSDSMRISNKTKPASVWAVEDWENTQTKASGSLLCCQQSQEVRCGEGGDQAVRAGLHTQLHQSGEGYKMQNVCVDKYQHTAGALSTQLGGRSNVEPPGRNQAHVDSRSILLNQTLFSGVQSQLAGVVINPPAERNLTAQASGTHLRPQLQQGSTLYLTSGKQHLQTYNFQQMSPPPRLHWPPRVYPSAGPRPVLRHNSFSSTYVAGQRAWRPLHTNMDASLGRSNSMTDRWTADFRGMGLYPNTR
ncbi:protein FAM83A-like [Cololabis saira]|uniref:protein FAM83A-like n=1 Tax=Cololabis saira TaxID=129043 RepID=UPI002AD3D8A9|nr:protein FAM83A-like [Cololabis saira]